MVNFASKKMKLDKGEFTEVQALEYCFSQIDRKTMERKKYNRLLAYRRRYELNELGIRAKESILIEFGFKLVGKVYEAPKSK